jgi:uncharacterized protein (UPF0179 family)
MGIKGKMVRLFSRNEAKRGTAPLESCVNSETLKQAGIRQNEVRNVDVHSSKLMLVLLCQGIQFGAQLTYVMRTCKCVRMFSCFQLDVISVEL